MVGAKTANKTARKPSQQRAVATVEAILEAAARILEREGITRSFGTNRIAREAGVSIGSLYEYFESKDAIIRTLCDRHVARVRALVDAAFEELREAPLDHAVDHFIDALFAIHEARPDLQRHLHREFPVRFGFEPFLETDKYVQGKLIEWLDRRTPDADRAELATRAFIAIRAARAVTVHVFMEALPEPEKGRVRESMKKVLVQTLAG
jgi:AcrR family transcriptional regulator